jgi:protoporphyrinogen oxidase
MSSRTAIIIGAGPAGLTAAYELLTRTDIRPVVIERDDCVGGISRTTNYKGNRIDLGGHRFFSKSDRVMDWWLDRMPIQAMKEGDIPIAHQGRKRDVGVGEGPDPDRQDLVMLVRNRKSRIYFRRRFFDYPVSLSLDTLMKLGFAKSFLIGLSYLRSAAFPLKNEQTLEDFLVNRFGRQLYLTFFKSYTEKVWGVPCDRISAEWGAQRIKGLSIWKAIKHALSKALPRKEDLSQKGTETTLIERFLYPKHGPGQMWEEVARLVRQKGGQIVMNCQVDRLFVDGRRIRAVEAAQKPGGERRRFDGDLFFSTMPIKQLLEGMGDAVPPETHQVSDGLMYRDFITVGLLVDDLKIKDKSPAGPEMVKDNWIYIQEPDVQVGRLQIFNNWSPYMVADPSKVWIGLEYFCNDTDELWRLPERQMTDLGREELARIGIIDKLLVRDSTVLHMPQTYPAYFGTYDRFGEIRSFVDTLENLYLVGRNGMHRYNNQDHSMLTAMTAVDNVVAGVKTKDNIWAVNTEQEYHEEKK